MSEQFDHDFIVIGSGFGGSVSALRLTEKGYDVAVLEQGKRFRAKDFPKSNWNLRKFLWAPALRCFGFFRMKLMRDVFVLSGVGVGGGSLVYANTLYVPPDAFFNSDEWPRGNDKDWKSILMPHYHMAQYMLGVQQNCYEGKADGLLKQAAEELGQGDSYIRTPVAVYFGEDGKTVDDPFFGGAGPRRTGCNLCGGCMVGCRFNAKNTLDKNYLYFAEKLGCTVRAERTVERVVALEGGGYEVHHRRTGGVFRKDRQVTRTKGVVLSAGVLGTTKLLFQSLENGDLPNISPYLGEKIRTNSEAIIGVSGRGDDDFSRGIAITSSIHTDESTHIEIVRYSKGSDALGNLTTIMADGGKPYPRVFEWIKNIVLHPLQFLRTVLPFGWAKKTIILLVMQSLDNSIRLKWGRSWLSLWQKDINTEKPKEQSIPTYIPVGHKVARGIANKINGTPQSSITEVLLDVPTTAHILGGASMGDSPENGVIDESHQVFGHPNLYVCDGSMVPANLGVNPSLTITAMSEHAMSKVPVKEGATLQPAVDPEWTKARVAERAQRYLETGNPNSHALARPEAIIEHDN